MDGYQPEVKCVNCIMFATCKKKHKNQVCKKYNGRKPLPPKSGSNVQTPTYTPPPMPEVKPPKQRTVLSVRDFAILYMVINDKIRHMESQAQWYHLYRNCTEEEVAKQMEEHMEHLRQDSHYQDLLRIREKLGELNIEVETPSVEVE